MAKKKKPEVPVVMAKGPVIDPKVTLEGELLPAIPRPGSLATVKKTRQESGRLYRDMRQGKIDPGVGSKLGYVLFNHGKLCESEGLEDRLARLEQMVFPEDTDGQH